jgi:hypothetical protein
MTPYPGHRLARLPLIAAIMGGRGRYGADLTALRSSNPQDLNNVTASIDISSSPFQSDYDSLQARVICCLFKQIVGFNAWRS